MLFRSMDLHINAALDACAYVAVAIHMIERNLPHALPDSAMDCVIEKAIVHLQSIYVNHLHLERGDMLCAVLSGHVDVAEILFKKLLFEGGHIHRIQHETCEDARPLNFS